MNLIKTVKSVPVLRSLDGAIRVVELTWIYPIYQTFYMVCYWLVAYFCGRPVVELWLSSKKLTLPSNRFVWRARSLFTVRLPACHTVWIFLAGIKCYFV